MNQEFRIKVLIILPLFIILFSLFWPAKASAHLAGQPPYFKVNGIYSSLYQVPTTSLDNFNLPQDISPQNFVVGDNVNFEIDTSQLPVLPSVLGDTKFYWDFGDGEKGEGLKQSHVYKKSGSFFLVINAQYQQEHSQLLQSMLINILPSKNYKLPKAVIKVDNFTPLDPLTDIYSVRPSSKLTFDASGSNGGDSKIESYFWDFGDENSGTKIQDIHVFDKKYAQVFPVIRVKTQDGFIADSFMEIKMDPNASISPLVNMATKKNNDLSDSWKNIIGVIIGIIIFIIIIFFSRRLKSSGK